MKKIIINFYFIFILLFLSINAQIVWDFHVNDKKDKKLKAHNNNLRSAFEVATESEMGFKTVINACLGTKPQCFELGVQTNTFYIWVRSAGAKEKDSETNAFDYTKSTTIQRNNKFFTKKVFGRKITGFEARDILTIDGKDYSRINFLILESSDTFRSMDGFIGLGYTPKNDERKFSIIQQLFENGVIPHKVFSQKYFTEQKGQLSIGEIPKYIVKDYTHYGRCAALDKVRDGKKYKNNNWQCKIDSIYFGGDENKIIPMSNNNEQKMQFLSYRKRSFVPIEVFDQIGNLFLKNQITEGKCTVKHHLRYSFYECDNDTVVQNLTFVFGDWEFTIQANDLFKKSKDGNSKELILYHKDNFEVFLLGRSILKGFEMVYDYANKQIGFYHESVRYKGKQKVTPPKIYQFLEDEEEYQPYKVRDGHMVLPETKPEEVKIRNTDNVEESMIYQITDVIKNILSILIMLVIVIILVAACIYSKKYSQKEKVRKATKYLQEEMVEKQNSEK
jgi:hypothetical protein